MKDLNKLKDLIINVPNYPKDGVNFKDITPLFKEPQILEDVIDEFAKFTKEIGATVIVGAESRGYLFSVPLSLKTKLPFVLIRKPNKLPRDVHEVSYDSEYGSSKVQIHKDSLNENDKVIIIDDLLASGGTVLAIEKLVEKSGAKVVGNAFLIELEQFGAKPKLSGNVLSILKY